MNEEVARESAFNPATDTPANLDEMKIWIEYLGIKEGTETYATMMREAMATWNSRGFQEIKNRENNIDENDTNVVRREGE